MKAILTPVMVTTSVETIQFGVQLPDTVHSRQFTISNDSKHLGIGVDLSRIAAPFRIHVKSMHLKPGEDGTVTVSYHPHHLGSYKKSLEIQLLSTKNNQCLKSFYIPLLAKCQMPAKKIESKPKKTAPHEKNLVPIPPLADPEAVQYKQRVKVYDDYIRASRKNRLVKTFQSFGLGENQVSNAISEAMKRETKELLEEVKNIDIKSGLIPPSIDIALPSDPKFDRPRESKLLSYFKDDDLKLNAETNWWTELAHIEGDEGDVIPLAAPTKVQVSAPNCSSSALALANLYFLPAAPINLGQITNHANKALLVKCANLAPNGQEMRLLWDGIHRDHIWISITPRQLTIPPGNIAFFKINMKAGIPPEDFLSDGSISFQDELSCMVNNEYKYSVGILAEIMPIRVEILGMQADNSLRFEAHTDINKPENELPVVEKTVVLHNPGSVSLNYQFYLLSNGTELQDFKKDEKGYFSISPQHGSMEPHERITVKMKYFPGLHAKVEETFALRVFDPTVPNDSSEIQRIVIRLNGETAMTRLAVMGTKSKTAHRLDFGVLSLTLPSKLETTAVPLKDAVCVPQTVRIKNLANHPCYFQVTTTVSDIKVFPSCGVLAGQGTILEIAVWVMPTELRKRTSNEEFVLVRCIGAMKAIQFPVVYDVIQPFLQVIDHNCFFSMPTPMGGVDKGSFKLCNISEANAKIIFHLRKWKAFSLKLEHVESNCQITSDTSASQVNIPRRHSLLRRNAIVGQHGKSSGRNNSVSDRRGGNFRVPTAEERASVVDAKLTDDDNQLYVLEIYPHQCTTIQLIFTPGLDEIDGAQYDFSIPFRFAGRLIDIGGTDCQINVRASVTDVGLRISQSKLYFEPMVIHPDTFSSSLQNKNSVPKATLTLKNAGKNIISWWFDTEYTGIDNNNTGLFGADIQGNSMGKRATVRRRSISNAMMKGVHEIFRFEQWNGAIKPGESLSVSVTFNPTVEGIYHMIVPIFTDIFGLSKPVYNIELSGIGIEPCLAFYPSEIFLPTVPLGEELIMSFALVNHGFERQEVRHEISEDILYLISGQLPSGMGHQTRENARSKRNVHAIMSGSRKENDPSAHSGSGQLEVFYPEGKLLRQDGESLNIAIRFRAPRQEPISFSTRLKFFVSYVNGPQTESKPFYVTVHGGSGQSMLSLWRYIGQTRVNHSFRMKTKSEAVVDQLRTAVVYERTYPQSILLEETLRR
jgi:hypothetical protein